MLRADLVRRQLHLAFMDYVLPVAGIYTLSMFERRLRQEMQPSSDVVQFQSRFCPRELWGAVLHRSRQMVIVLAILGGPASIAWGDGYHGAALAAKSLESWENKIAASLDLERVAGAKGNQGGELVAGRDLQDLAGRTTTLPYRRRGGLIGATGRAQVNELVGVLAWMDTDNIIPREFPDFAMDRISAFRETAKNMLAAVGSDAVDQLLDDLVNPPSASGTGMRVAPTFQADILDTLGRIGRLPPRADLSLERVSVWLKVLSRSSTDPERKNKAARAIISMLPTDKIKRLSSNPLGMQARVVELAHRFLDGDRNALDIRNRVKELRRLVRVEPCLFLKIVQAQGAVDWVADLDQVAARKESLLRQWVKTRNFCTFRLLLRSSDGEQVLDDEDWDDLSLRRAILEYLEQGNAPPTLATWALEQERENIAHAELKKIAELETGWRKVGAFGLLLKQLPPTRSEAAWIIEFFNSEGQKVDLTFFCPQLVGRIKHAPAAAIIELMGKKCQQLRTTVTSILRERVRTPARKLRIVEREKELITYFCSDSEKYVDLVDILAALRTRASLNTLINVLTDENPRVRQKSRNALAKIHRIGLEYGPANSATLVQRRAAQAKWREWLSQFKTDD